MKNIMTLTRLQFKLAFKNNILYIKDKNNLFTLLLVTIIGGGILSLIFYSLIVLFNNFLYNQLGEVIIALFIFVFQILHFLFIFGNIVKKLYNIEDNHILQKLPLSPFQIFISKILSIFIIDLIFSSLLFIPAFVYYGLITNMPISYYFMVVIITLICELLIFGLSCIFAIPYVKIIKFIVDKFFLKILALIIIISVFMIGYSFLLDFIINIIKNDYRDFSNEFVSSMLVFIDKLVLSKMFVELLYGVNVGQNLGLILLLLSSMTGIIIILIKYTYLKIIQNHIDDNRSSFLISSKNRKKTKEIALFNKEFKVIYRSSNYIFQFLAISFSMPVLIYFCNNLVAGVGIEAIGERVIAGVSVLLTLVLVTISNSFAATSITREGSRFYQMKTMPVSFIRQLSIKIALYLLISIPMIAISIITIAIAGYIDPAQTILLIVSLIMITISLTIRFVLYDLRQPSFSKVGQSEIVSVSKALSEALINGITAAIFLGCMTIIITYLSSVIISLLLLLLLASIYLTYTVLTFKKKANKYALLLEG